MTPQEALQNLATIANDHPCNAQDRIILNNSILTLDAVVKDFLESAKVASGRPTEGEELSRPPENAPDKTEDEDAPDTETPSTD